MGSFVYFMGDDKMAHLQRFGRYWLLAPRGLGLHSCMPASSMATFKMKPVSAAETVAGGEDFFERNKRLARPTSPHLTIHKMQLTAVLSITHRGTGCAQSALLSGAAILALTSKGNFGDALTALQAMQFGGATIFAAKFALAFPFTYPLFNGIRHLIWDTGRNFSIPAVYSTGWTMLGVSLVSAIALCLI